MKTADNSLEIGAILDNRYRIDGVLGVGGFGITYKAHDDTLDCTVVIKEYLPEECGARDSDTVSVIPRTNRENDYQYGLEKYLEEARTLAKFQHPNIVGVTNFIKTNGTAYFVMNYAEGEDLSDWLKKHETLNEDIILKIITPILEGLAEVHKTGLLHRDIKPGNIFMRKQGGAMLIDFGAARQALGEQSKSISAIISQGYAPPEQYTTRGKQGAFTDLYAIGATLYKLITGKAPIESADRAHDVHEGEPDPMVPSIEAGKGKVGDWLLQLTDQMLQISAKNRPQNAEAVLQAIKNKTTADVGCAARTETQSEPDNKTRVVRSGERFDKKLKRQPEQNTSGAHGAPYGKIAAVIVVVVAIAGGGWWFSQSDSSNVAVNATTQSKTLTKGSAILYVDSQPADAEIYLDNILLGRTPYKNEALPKGEHEIKLSHASAETHKEKLVLKDNIIVKKQYQLKAASGSVSLFSTPEGARITLDGKDTGLATPATLKSVSTGDHQIVLHKDSYYPKEITINVIKGKASREDLALEGGHLVEYEGEWLEPGEKEKRVAEEKRIAEQQSAEAKRIAEQKAADAEKARRIAEQKAADAREAKRIADKKAREQKAAEAKQQRIERLAGKMINIPAGSFKMGSNSLGSAEKPVHRVNLKAFKLGQHEVTQKQWQAVMGNNPSYFKNCDDCPVEQVSWNNIQSFLKKLNQQTGSHFRLPSEAEWEYACRSGGKDQKHCGGNNASALAWYSSNESTLGLNSPIGGMGGYGSKSSNKTHPVKQKQANGLALYDMSGNVWEWTQDCFNDSYNGAPSNGEAWQIGDCTHRMLRGFSWRSVLSNSSSANRIAGPTANGGIGDGFRLAQDIQEDYVDTQGSISDLALEELSE